MACRGRRGADATTCLACPYTFGRRNPALAHYTPRFVNRFFASVSFATDFFLLFTVARFAI